MEINNEKIPTYKDFEMDQMVTCLKIDDFWEQHLTIGKQYKIIDLDFHFPKSICIDTDNGVSMFVPILLFWDTIAEKREKRIDNIIS